MRIAMTLAAAASCPCSKPVAPATSLIFTSVEAAYGAHGMARGPATSMAARAAKALRSAHASMAGVSDKLLPAHEMQAKHAAA